MIAVREFDASFLILYNGTVNAYRMLETQINRYHFFCSIPAMNNFVF